MQCRTALKFEKEILKIGRSFEYAECGYFTLLFSKERQRNEQRIITYAYRTAIVLVAVAVEVCLLRKVLNRINGKIMNSQTSTIQTKAQPNKMTAESIENISPMRRLLKIKTYQMTQGINKLKLPGSSGTLNSSFTEVCEPLLFVITV